MILKNMGIGKALMKVCYKELFDFIIIAVWVLESNKKAIGFYKSEGFKKDGYLKVIYTKKTIRMKKMQHKISNRI